MKKTDGRRKFLLLLAAVRSVVALAAILAAKFLIDDHYLWLVLMRPTKEVFLFGAFLARREQDAGLLLEIALAGLPLLVAGVWLFYFLGRMYSEEIEADEMPRWARKVLPAHKVRTMESVLQKKGAKLVFLTRLAVFPSTVVAAAAGASEMGSRRFMRSDGLGAAASMIEVMAVGYFLGEFFDPEDPVTSWTITGLGVAATLALLYLLGRYVRKDARTGPAGGLSEPPPPAPERCSDSTGTDSADRTVASPGTAG